MAMKITCEFQCLTLLDIVLAVEPDNVDDPSAFGSTPWRAHCNVTPAPRVEPDRCRGIPGIVVPSQNTDYINCNKKIEIKLPQQFLLNRFLLADCDFSSKEKK